MYPLVEIPEIVEHYTQPDFCRFLDQELKLTYVGTLSGTDRVLLRSGETTLDTFAEQLKQEHLMARADGGKPVFHRISIPFKGAQETYYSYCCTHHLCGFMRQCLVINHR